MLNLFLRKSAIAAGIVAGALCIAYTTSAQVGTPTFSSGGYVFRFKGTTTEGLPQYEVFKGDADIGTVTQTLKGYGYKANDEATIKDTKDVPTAVTNLTHRPAYLDEKASPASRSFRSAPDSNQASTGFTAPNGLTVVTEFEAASKTTTFRITDPNPSNPLLATTTLTFTPGGKGQAAWNVLRKSVSGNGSGTLSGNKATFVYGGVRRSNLEEGKAGINDAIAGRYVEAANAAVLAGNGSPDVTPDTLPIFDKAFNHQYKPPLKQ